MQDQNSTEFEEKARGTWVSPATSRSCVGRVYRNVGNVPLLKMLDLARCGTVLDCGCGAGDNAQLLRCKGWNVTGITLSPAEKELASETCSAVWVHDLEKGLPSDLAGPFDLVVLSHILEHLRCPEVILSELRRVLRPGGCIAVAVPNVLNWYQRVQFLVGRFEYAEQGIMDSTHVRFYTLSSARRLLESCGWEVFKEKAAGSILPWGKLRRIVPRVPEFIDAVACRIRPGLFGRQLLYVARAK